MIRFSYNVNYISFLIFELVEVNSLRPVSWWKFNFIDLTLGVGQGYGNEDNDNRTHNVFLRGPKFHEVQNTITFRLTIKAWD